MLFADLASSQREVADLQRTIELHDMEKEAWTRDRESTDARIEGLQEDVKGREDTISELREELLQQTRELRELTLGRESKEREDTLREDTIRRYSVAS